MKCIGRVLAAIVCILGSAVSLHAAQMSQNQHTAQVPQNQAGQPASTGVAAAADVIEREKLNAGVVGLAGGQLESAPILLATEIARVADDGDNLHVLPIVTRGQAENVEALLNLLAVDVAIINTDALEQFKPVVPSIQQKISYIINLQPSKLQVFARPGIKSLDDLKGKKVNFNTPGTAAAYTGPLIFEKLHLDVQKAFIPHQVALEQMRTGQNDIAALVFVTSKPIDAFVHGHWEPGFGFLPVKLSDNGFYLPSKLTSEDYPQLIQPGQDVETLAVPTVLATYNWPSSSDRYKRIALLTNTLFDRLDKLREPGFSPLWKDVNVASEVPGLRRFQAAQEWIDKTHIAKALVTADQGEDERSLFQEFVEWKKFLEWKKTKQQ